MFLIFLLHVSVVILNCYSLVFDIIVITREIRERKFLPAHFIDAFPGWTYKYAYLTNWNMVCIDIYFIIYKRVNGWGIKENVTGSIYSSSPL